MYLDDYDVLPGDELTITNTFTVTEYDGYNTIETEEGLSIDTGYVDVDITSRRPENWPPENGDVWRIGGYTHVYLLGDEFYDEDGTNYTLSELLSDSSMSAMDMSLVFRSGVVIHAKA